MIRGLYTAASGMLSSMRRMEFVTNNLANAQTAGFKQDRSALSTFDEIMILQDGSIAPPGVHTDLGELGMAAVAEEPMIDFTQGALQETNRSLDMALEGPGFFTVQTPDGEGNVIMDARETGTGVRTSGIVQNLNEGIMMATDDPMDIAIDGDGLLEVTLQDGQTAYIRGASLRMDGMRRLVTSNGAMISPTIEVPADVIRVEVTSDGSIIGHRPEGDPQTLGQLKLVRFDNPEGLQMIGGALLPTVASDAPIESVAGEPGVGKVVTSVIEASNIDAREEYLRIIQAQRAYELNVRALKTVDEMLGDANNLRRQ